MIKKGNLITRNPKTSAAIGLAGVGGVGYLAYRHHKSKEKK